MSQYISILVPTEYGKQVFAKHPYNLHQRLCDGFPDQKIHAERNGSNGFLFSLLDGVITVQSSSIPDWDRAFSNNSELLVCNPTVEERRLQFQVGEVLNFRLLAAPSKEVARDTPKIWDGKDAPTDNQLKRLKKTRRFITDPSGRFNWMLERAKGWGFSLESLRWSRHRNLMDRKRSYRNNEPVVHDIVVIPTLYYGRLVVADPNLFAAHLAAGFGRSKGLGCGLMLF